jgi:hypothetical protein
MIILLFYSFYIPNKKAVWVYQVANRLVFFAYGHKKKARLAASLKSCADASAYNN